MRTVIRLVVAASLVAATQVAAPHAGAVTTFHAGKFAYVITKSDVPPGNGGPLVAACPQGMNVVGGGVAFAGKPDNLLRVAYVLFDSALKTTLTGGAYNGTGTTRTMVVTAICMKLPTPTPTYSSATINNLSGFQTPTAPCAAQHVLLGGTGGAEPPNSTLLMSTFPLKGSGPTPAQEWDTRGFSATSGKYTASAVCDPSGTRVRHVEREVVLDANQRKTVRVNCPSGTHVSAGGWDTLTALVATSESKPVDGPDAGNAPDNGWVASVVNFSTESTVLAVHALCVR